ncbi:S8 family serine peptidase [Geobacter argillaceus]|uniref:Putative repeat protein (TIGR01451 family) n=1 Tax=Geobacter argillaceus TaxID=345631 RepID=A0A562VMF9_9BACT|nr:S8 family serine peptidase [Geobacter argillaceus]TWJ19075.1 putative repeat protein (TIGR01451 family) [Geobacter argillaceus]
MIQSVFGGKRQALTVPLLIAVTLAWPINSHAETAYKKVPAEIAGQLAAGVTLDVIVLFDDDDIEREAQQRRSQTGIHYDDEALLAFKAGRYRQIKQQVEAGMVPGDGETVEEYAHLPMAVKRFRSKATLEAFLAKPEVTAVYANRSIYPHLTYSLPFINQPAVAGIGMTGSNTTVAVIDTGINYTLPAFGSCTAPGVPASCRVAASVDVTGNGVTLNTDPTGHGTNVAGIVAGVATGTRIAAINAFSAGASSTSWVIAGIDWAIQNKAAFGIAAINMSLGDGSNNSSACGNKGTNPFVTPINNAMAAGIIPVASSGNSGFTAGMGSPACTPGVVSVGAVYDANWGGPYTWSANCTDSSSGPDMIPCFSNSASFLTMLAPGAFITAAGIQMAGTSQASPHVAGAVAVVRAAFPGETLDQTVARLTSSGISVTDNRNGITKPRLNLLAAIGPPFNDMFANRALLSGDAGQVVATNLNATKEQGEPLHAGNAGGRSVWWHWTPSTSGKGSFNTHGSGFDTLLAVYTGTIVTGLTQIAANDNDGSPGNTSGLTFTALAGNDYLIAVDGFNGAAGSITLNWNLALQADLAVAMTVDKSAPVAGSTLTYSVTVSNAGPSAAVNLLISAPIPAGSSFVSATPGCTVSTGKVSCSMGTLAANASSSVQIAISPGAAGSLTFTANAAADTPDPVATNNSASVTVTVLAAGSPAVPALSVWGILAGFAILMGIGLRRGEIGTA